MTIKRRSFLGLLGMSPLAAKIEADKAIGTLTGVKVDAPRYDYAIPASSFQHESGTDASKYITTFGLPDFELERLRRTAKRIHALDPDIAAKRSWSMSVKILTQQQRNFEQMKQETYDISAWSLKKEAFVKTFGFWFKTYFY